MQREELPRRSCVSRDALIVGVWERSIQRVSYHWRNSSQHQAAVDAVGESLCRWLAKSPDINEPIERHVTRVSAWANSLLVPQSRRRASRWVRVLTTGQRLEVLKYIRGKGAIRAGVDHVDRGVPPIEELCAEPGSDQDIEIMEALDSWEHRASWVDTAVTDWREAIEVLRAARWQWVRIASLCDASRESVRQWVLGGYEPRPDKQAALITAATEIRQADAPVTR
jgi:hypothetical protein